MRAMTEYIEVITLRMAKIWQPSQSALIRNRFKWFADGIEEIQFNETPMEATVSVIKPKEENEKVDARKQ